MPKNKSKQNPKNNRLSKATNLKAIIPNKELNDSLASAIIADSPHTVKSLLLKGADVNIVVNASYTPLYWAIENKYDDIVIILLGRGADINAKMSQNTTPLHLAVQHRYAEIVTLLLANKEIDINAKMSQNTTPLHLAAQYGYIEIVKLLLDKGADINAKGVDDWTPLHVAAQHGYIEIVKLLLTNREIDINSKTNANNSTPLHVAVQHGHTKVVKLLLDKGADINAKDIAGSTALHTAAQEGQAKVVKLLLDKGADINAKETDGFTALHAAAQNGHTKVVKIFLGRGADINAKSADYCTPLHLAAAKGHADIVELLLANAKIDINAKSADYCTPLHYAIAGGHAEVVKLLLLASDLPTVLKTEFYHIKSKEIQALVEIAKIALSIFNLESVDSNKGNSKYETEMSQRIEKGKDNGNSTLVKAFEDKLLELQEFKINVFDNLVTYNKPLVNKDYIKQFDNKYSNILPKDLMGQFKSSIFSANFDLFLQTIKEDDVSLFKTIIKDIDVNYGGHLIGNKGDSLIAFIVKEGANKILKYVSENYDIADITSSSGNTLLHYAARSGNVKAIKLLIDYGADVNIQNARQNTPLHLAIKSNNTNTTEVVTALLGAKTATEVKTAIEALYNQQLTPLYMATCKGNIELIKLLLGYGAEIDAINHGYTCLHKAIHDGNLELVEVFLAKGADVNMTNDKGRSALDMLNSKKGKELVTSGFLDVKELVGKYNKQSESIEGDNKLTLSNKYFVNLSHAINPIESDIDIIGQQDLSEG